MARFIFKMENILQVKEKLEDQAKAEYGLELMKLREEEEKKMQMEGRKLGYEGKLTIALQNYLDLRNIRRLENAVEVLKFQIKLQEEVIKRQEEQVAKAREKLNEAMKERKTYEKLKEKAFDVFRQELNAQEQKETDELVSYRHRNGTESED